MLPGLGKSTMYVQELKSLLLQKVAWPRKTVATKRSDIRVWPRLHNNNAICKMKR